MIRKIAWVLSFVTYFFRIPLRAIRLATLILIEPIGSKITIKVQGGRDITVKWRRVRIVEGFVVIQGLWDYLVGDFKAINGAYVKGFEEQKHPILGFIYLLLSPFRDLEDAAKRFDSMMFGSQGRLYTGREYRAGREYRDLIIDPQDPPKPFIGQREQSEHNPQMKEKRLGLGPLFVVIGIATIFFGTIVTDDLPRLFKFFKEYIEPILMLFISVVKFLTSLVF